MWGCCQKRNLKNLSAKLTRIRVTKLFNLQFKKHNHRTQITLRHYFKQSQNWFLTAQWKVRQTRGCSLRSDWQTYTRKYLATETYCWFTIRNLGNGWKRLVVACNSRALAFNTLDSSIRSWVVAWAHYAKKNWIGSWFKVEGKLIAIRKFLIEKASKWAKYSKWLLLVNV